MKGDDIPVEISTDLGSLRAMLNAIDQALKSWPGGDPQEQINMMNMRNDLFGILMSYLLANDLV